MVLIVFGTAHFKQDTQNDEVVWSENESITINLKPCYMTYFDHCMLLGHYKIGMEILTLNGLDSFLNGNFMIYLREMINAMLYSQKPYDNGNLKYYTNIVRNLYSMGADIHNIYHNRHLKGFSYLFDIIRDSNEIFEIRQMALAKILQHFIKILDFDVCFMLVSYIPYINETMIQKQEYQKGMVLTKNKY